MQFFLKINNNIIEKANFVTDGCGASVATASQTTILIEGKSLDFAEQLKPEDVDQALKGLPEDHKHCTELAVRTLKRAIKKYKDKLQHGIKNNEDCYKERGDSKNIFKENNKRIKEIEPKRYIYGHVPSKINFKKYFRKS